MIKCVCDICRKNEADEHFKVKKLVPTLLTELGVFDTWERIDICQECYNKLIKGLEDEKNDRP
ncbi:MAG: hypothetical protein ACLU8W_09990 [Clostridia bacterium]